MEEYLLENEVSVLKIPNGQAEGKNYEPDSKNFYSLPWGGVAVEIIPGALHVTDGTEKLPPTKTEFVTTTATDQYCRAITRPVCMQVFVYSYFSNGILIRQ